MTTGRAVVGILVGVMAGALMGMIYGKRKGRTNISRKGAALANAINDKIDERFGEITNSFADKIMKDSRHRSDTLRPD